MLKGEVDIDSLVAESVNEVAVVNIRKNIDIWHRIDD